MTEEVNIILFGQLAQLAGSDKIIISGISDTLQLRNEVNKMFPALQHIDYAIAVGKKIVHENILVDGRQTIALLPPFSGG